METTINAVGFSFENDQQELITKKLKRVQYAADSIIDLALRVKLDKEFIFECTINFRWGSSAHVSESDYDFAAGLNKMMDVLDVKLKKEKEKNQQNER
jgi:putative sigma-54 modulation protein